MLWSSSHPCPGPSDTPSLSPCCCPLPWVHRRWHQHVPSPGGRMRPMEGGSDTAPIPAVVGCRALLIPLGASGSTPGPLLSPPRPGHHPHHWWQWPPWGTIPGCRLASGAEQDPSAPPRAAQRLTPHSLPCPTHPASSTTPAPWRRWALRSPCGHGLAQRWHLGLSGTHLHTGCQPCVPSRFPHPLPVPPHSLQAEPPRTPWMR